MKRTLAALVFAAAVTVAPSSAGAAGGAAAVGVFHPPVQWIGHNTVKSSNWSGYAVQDASKFTQVTGKWTQPTSTCTSSAPTYASFWIGIDGYVSNSVEQLGTDSDCASGSPRYYAWYEMFPANSVNLSTTKYPVKAGDHLTSSVSRSGTTYTLSLSSSEGWTFSITKSQSGLKNSSAEWIAESPSLCNASSCTLAKLTDFGIVHWTGAEAAVGGALEAVSSFTADSGPHKIIKETSGGVTEAQPSALGSTGETFSITWKHT